MATNKAQHPAARSYYEPCRRQTPQTSLPGWRHAAARLQLPRAQLPLKRGGLGLGSSKRLRHAAYWGSWADTVRALRKHQPGILAALLRSQLDASGTGILASTRAAEVAALPQKAYQRKPWRDCWRKMQRHQCHTQHDPLREEDRAGKVWHRRPSTSTRSRCSSTTSTQRLKRCCCHRVAMQRAAPSRPSQRAPTRGCRTRSTESCSSANSACPSRSSEALFLRWTLGCVRRRSLGLRASGRASPQSRPS